MCEPLDNLINVGLDLLTEYVLGVVWALMIIPIILKMMKVSD